MSSSHLPQRVVAVVVAYNRSELLQEVLDALQIQELPAAATVVIDNASTDDSAERARSHTLATDVVTLTRNTGGAGGFAAGIARALDTHNADWVWVMDDDTIPTPQALAELLGAAAQDSSVVMAGSRVVWTNGQEHPMNTPRRKPFAGRGEREAAQGRGVLPVRSSSFVSMLVRADVIIQRGLPITDYFIWNDDFEYSTRILRRNRGIFVPRSVVVHKTLKLGSTDVDPGERFYYEVRNKLWMLRFSHSLNPGEKLLYGASSIRRWLRTVARSKNRAVLRHSFWRGWRDGWRTKPRPNSVALGGFGEISEQVTLVEDGVKVAVR